MIIKVKCNRKKSTHYDKEEKVPTLFDNQFSGENLVNIVLVYSVYS